EGTGVQLPRRLPDERALLRAAGRLLDDDHRGLQVLDAALDVRLARGLVRAAVAFVVHGPDVVAQAREVIHHRVALPVQQLQVEHGAARVRRAMDAEKAAAEIGLVEPLAIEPELHAVLVGPVLARDDGPRRGHSNARSVMCEGRKHGRSGKRRARDQRGTSVGHGYSPGAGEGWAASKWAAFVIGPLPEYRSRYR